MATWTCPTDPLRPNYDPHAHPRRARARCDCGSSAAPHRRTPGRRGPRVALGSLGSRLPPRCPCVRGPACGGKSERGRAREHRGRARPSFSYRTSSPGAIDIDRAQSCVSAWPSIVCAPSGLCSAPDPLGLLAHFFAPCRFPSSSPISASASARVLSTFCTAAAR